MQETKVKKAKSAPSKKITNSTKTKKRKATKTKKVKSTNPTIETTQQTVITEIKKRGRKPKKQLIDNNVVNVTDSYETFSEFFNNFCFTYADLIESYEEASNTSFSSAKSNIYKAFQEINKNDGINYDNILVGAIHGCLGRGNSIADEIERYATQSDYEYDRTTLQRYFDDVGYVYERNNNKFDIEYSLENRDKLIEMNLKNVITIAKGYRGNRLSLEELISAGNEGLCVAFDKYDPTRQKLKNQLLDQIESAETEDFSYDEVVGLFKPMLSYGNIKALFTQSFDKKGKYSKDNLKSWVNKNIRPAKFNSVAVMWINAYILIELDNYSRLIKKPKKEIKKEKTGESPKEVFYDLSEPVGKDGTHTLGEVLDINDDTVEEYEVEEAQTMFRDALMLLLEGIKLRNKRITLQRFGIGLPRPMSPKEISQREGISIARVSQIIQMTLDDMRKNYERHKDQIDPDTLYEFLGRCENCI